MLLLLLALLFVLMLLGMDVGFVLLTSSVLVVLLTAFSDFTVPIEVIAQYIFGGINSFSFTAIPLFILAGEIMNQGKITDKLLDFAEKLVGHIRGGVAQTGVGLNVVMAGISGSAVADCASTGSILIPAMKKSGYSPERSASIIASASTIGPVIPPSIPLIIIGSIAGISVGKLFLAGIIPGLLMGLALMMYIYVYARKKGMVPKEKASFNEKFNATRKAILALFLPILIVASIVLGIASPTEAAAVCVIYALFITIFVYRTIDLKGLIEVFKKASITSGAIMIVAAGGILYGWVATYFHLGDFVANLLFSISTNPIVVLLLVNIILLILGMVLEAIPIILLTVPIFFPILTDLGIDPVHFSIIMCVNLMIGLVTPPIGLHLFITASIAKVPIGAIIRDVLPFVFVLIVVLMLITFVPSISLFIPNLLG